MWLSRHGTADDEDEEDIFKDFPCGETVSWQDLNQWLIIF